MLRRSLAVLLVATLSSCGSGGGGSVLGPGAAPAVVVSGNAADRPDYLCDGIEDDVEINQALRKADSTESRTVRLAAGTYRVRASVIVTSNLTLQGSGSATVVALEDNAPSMVSSAGIIRLKDNRSRGTATRVRNVTLEDFVVDGNRTNQLAVDEKKFGIYAEGDSLVLRRLVAKNCAGYGFDPHSTSDTVVSTHVTIEDCEAFGNAMDGFTMDGIESSTFSRNHAHDNDRHGFNLVTATAGVILSNCRSVRNGATGVMVQNSSHDVTIQGCEVADNALEGLFLRDADGCSLLGNTVTNNARSAIVLRLSDRTTISGNDLMESDTAFVGRAVVLLDSATVNIVRSNTIVSKRARDGVREAGTSDYNVVSENVINVRSQAVVLIGPHSTQSGNR